MQRLKEYSDSFKLKFEKFLISCDALEEMGLWDLAEHGEMDVFYSADLTSIIIHMIAVDGKITQKEVDYLNDMFGFAYSQERLAALYEENAAAIDDVFDGEAQSGLNLMRAINEKLAAAYVDLIGTICDVIIASDGVIAAAEIERAKRIKALIA